MFNKIYIYAQKYIFNLKNIYLFSKKNIYLCSKVFIYICSKNIYLCSKNIPEQFIAIGPPSFIRGEGVGSQKRWHYSRGIGLRSFFVRRFRRRFRPDEFSSAGDLLWRPISFIWRGGGGRGGEGRGEGQKVLIIALLLLWKVFLN